MIFRLYFHEIEPTFNSWYILFTAYVEFVFEVFLLTVAIVFYSTQYTFADFQIYCILSVSNYHEVYIVSSFKMYLCTEYTNMLPRIT